MVWQLPVGYIRSMNSSTRHEEAYGRKADNFGTNDTGVDHAGMLLYR